MAYDLNADEIFEMVIRIESNGARFYRKAAGFQSDSSNRKMLEKLAIMEDHHQTVFEEMRKGLTEADKTITVFDPHNEASQYLAAMADAHGGEGSPAAADSLSGKESLAEIIDIAIGLEKESILFYIGLKDMVPPKYGRDKLDKIISEERKHVVELSTLRKRFYG
jgi:rubrerythrin